MSVATCNALGIIYDPTQCTALQSANSETEWALGIAKDVPFRFGEVTAILQVHIVDSPAYDVLLGRPFEVLTQACTQSFLSGDQHITLTDPNTKRMVMIPTVPRKPPQFQKMSERVGFGAQEMGVMYTLGEKPLPISMECAKATKSCSWLK